MRSPLLLAGLLFTGCATTGLGNTNREPVEHARVQLAPLVADNTRLVPQAVETPLPSADRIAHVIQARLGSQASVDVHYCVSPAGKVVGAELERRSDLEAFDQAVLTDILTWQFAAQPGPDSVKSCDRATILYRPRS